MPGSPAETDGRRRPAELGLPDDGFGDCGRHVPAPFAVTPDGLADRLVEPRSTDMARSDRHSAVGRGRHTARSSDHAGTSCISRRPVGERALLTFFTAAPASSDARPSGGGLVGDRADRPPRPAATFGPTAP